MTKDKITGSLLLLAASLIWGLAFVAQSVGMEFVGPFTFNAARSLIGALALAPFALLHEKSELKTGLRKTARAGLVCGLIVFVATNLQQAGLLYTSAGKAGFITSFYIVLVPVAGIFLKKRTSVLTWAAVGLAVAGLYLLCFGAGEGLRLEKGDALVFFCALAFTAHILAIDRYAPAVDVVLLSCLQFFISGLLSLAAALLFERPSLPALYMARLPVLYTGVLSSGAAYTFQIVGQKRLRPQVASLLMSFEAVFAALAGWLLLRQGLSARELVGCCLLLAAIIMVQTAPVKGPVKAAPKARRDA